MPVSILWGEKDPWEPIELGRAYADYDCVEEFIALPGDLFGAWCVCCWHCAQVLVTEPVVVCWQAQDTAHRMMRPCWSTQQFWSL